MRHVITVCAVLALTFSLEQGTILGNARAIESPQKALGQRIGSKPTPAEHAMPQTSWIGDRAKVVLNRSWMLESDGTRVVLAQAPEAKPGPASTGPYAGLADQVRKAKGEFRTVTDADLSAAQADLKDKVGRLAWLLSNDSAAAKPDNDRWKEVLQWTQLQAAIAPNAKPNAAELHKLVDAVHEAQSSDTLDRPLGSTDIPQASLDFRTALNDVRAALQRYRLLAIAAGPNGRADVENQLEELAVSLSADPATWISGANPDPGELLGRLQAEGQVPQLITEIRRYFAQPNLMIRVPPEFVETLFAGPVKDTEYEQGDTVITDVILGTDVVARRGLLDQKIASVRLVPNNEHAVLDAFYVGTVATNSIGYHPPVTITSHGITNLSATVRIDVDAGGNKIEPPCGSACVHNCIDCISVCGGRLVQRIATRKVYQSKGEAECIAGQHAAARLDAKLTTSFTDALTVSNGNYNSKIRDPLMSWGAFPRSVHYATTTSDLTIHALEASDGQLAAPTSPPEVKGSPFLAVRVHQSFIDNLLALSLGGRTVSQAQFEDGIGNLFGPFAGKKIEDRDLTPEEIKEKEAIRTDIERDNFWNGLKFKRENRKITFANENPVTILFTDQGFSITIRGTAFIGEDLETHIPENITGVYKIVEGRATRVGPLDFALPQGLKLTPLQVGKVRGERDKLRPRFETLLPETIEFNGLNFDTANRPWYKLGILKADRIQSGDGWLSIDWSQVEKSNQLEQ